jgi:hypothetical protein
VSKRIGDLLEDVVAKLPFKEGWTIQKRQKLPVLESRIQRHREIDILYTREVGGNQIRFAVSCKNEKEKVGIQHIGDFLMALKEVGIAPDQALVVSVKGFTRDAKDCACTHRLQICTYSGLNKKRNAEQIGEAFFRKTFYLINDFVLNVFHYVEAEPSDENSHIKLEISDPEDLKGQLLLFNVWKRWIGGQIPMQLGSHRLHFMPTDSNSSWRAIAYVDIEGYYFDKKGTFTHGILHDNEAKNVVAARFDAKFDEVTSMVTLRKLESQQEFDSLVSSGKLRISSRVRVPRILTQAFGFFPPTIAEAERAKNRFESGQPIFDDTNTININDAWAD